MRLSKKGLRANMFIIPTSWSFTSRKGEKTILVEGKSPVKEADGIMLEIALNIINVAEAFQGVLVAQEPENFGNQDEDCLTVSFTLRFPNNWKKSKFKNYWRSG